MPDSPCVERGVEHPLKVGIRRVLSFEKCFHEFPRLLCPAKCGEVPPRLRVRCAVRRDLTIVFHSQKQILLGPFSDLGEEHSCQVRWSIDLFKRALHYRTERVM